MTSQGKSQYLIEEVAGCGQFQCLMAGLVHALGRAPYVFSVVLLIFSVRNPGWRCLDYNTTLSINTNFTSFENISSIQFDNTSHQNKNMNYSTSSELFRDNCPVYEACSNVQFNPDESTVLAEWGLLCGKNYGKALILSLHMIGLATGVTFMGQLGDTIGRKTTLYSVTAVIAVLNTVIIFSTSWQMFAAVRFLLGVLMAAFTTLTYIYVTEFVTMKCRAPLASVPSFSGVAMIGAVFVMLLKDWQHLQILAVGICIVALIPAIWVPESLRWLEAKNKTKKFIKACDKIVKLNGKVLPPIDSLIENTKQSTDVPEDKKIYSTLDLFRPGYKIYSIAIAVVQFSSSIWYYGISFSIDSLSGNFYINLILNFACDTPLQIIPMFLSNLIGRRKAGVLFIGIATLCFFSATGFMLSSHSSLQTHGVRVVIMVGKAMVICNWCVAGAHGPEVYPTVVRGLGQGWGDVMTRIAGIIAPFIIPSNYHHMYITYSIMSVLGIISCIAILSLPETRGKPLKQTFDDEETTNNVEETNA